MAILAFFCSYFQKNLIYHKFMWKIGVKCGSYFEEVGAIPYRFFQAWVIIGFGVVNHFSQLFTIVPNNR
jgi:hypothetical protein